MNIEEAKAKVRRIVEANTKYTEVHQLADAKAEINILNTYTKIGFIHKYN